MTIKTKLFAGFSAILLTSFAVSFALAFFFSQNQNRLVANTQSDSTGTVLPAQITPTPTPPITTPTPTPQDTRSQVKGEITIALLGDSMVDTLAPFTQLQANLSQIYPNVKFKILNYGVGATNIDSGITRLNNSYRYKDQDVPPLLSQKPDLVIVESFAYNHAANDQSGFDHQNNGYSQIVGQLKNNNTHILMMATISPSYTHFGQGAPGINFAKDQRENEVLTINNYLKNAITYTKDNQMTLIDAYTPSKTTKNDGNLTYINSSDRIHPSPEGIVFVSDIIATTISKNRLIEIIITSKK